MAPTRRIGRFLLRALVIGAVGALGIAAPADAGNAKAPAKTAKARKATPVSAEHKKALAELYAGFKFGMTKDEVIGVFSKQLDERYDEKIKATTDLAAQDRLRRDKKGEVSRLEASYISFESNKPSPWDVSIIEDEFAHNTGEAMLERWENQNGKNQRRFFFFHGGKLWKIFVSLDMSILPEDKKNFATFRQVMEGKYGPGDVEAGRITWRTPEFDVRAIDKLKSYDALALVIEEPRTKKEIIALREAKAPPPKDTNPIIKAVIDPKRTDRPDVKQNSDAVDQVIKAQGGSPPKSN
jgi:hypothetical protein